MDSSNSSSSACTSTNSIELPSSLYWTEAEKLIIWVSLPLITTVGDVGNLAFLFTTFRVARMRTTANFYLAILALLDINFITQVCITYIYGYTISPKVRSNWQPSTAWCWSSYLFSFFCYMTSQLVITLLSLERCYAICYPLKHRLFTGKSRIAKQMILSLLLGLGLGVVGTIKWGDFSIIKLCVKELNNDLVYDEPYLLVIYTCQLRNGRALASLLAEGTATLVFLLTFISSSVMYAKVLKTLSERSETNLQSNIPGNDKVHRQVAKMLIANGVIFFTCQIPYRLYSIHDILADTLQVWSLSEHQRASLVIVGRVFLYLNSAVNPYIYVAGSTFYRKAFMEAFGFYSKTNGANGSIKMNTISSSVVQ